MQGRLNACCDLVAEEAVYHWNCFRLFVDCHKPLSLSADRKGWPTDDHMAQSFETLCWWLEDNIDDLCSLDELHLKMISIAGSADVVYSKKHLKRKLIKHYGDNIFFSEVNGNTILCVSGMQQYRWYRDCCCNPEEDSMRVVVASAKLIRAQILASEYSIDQYPLNAQFHDVDRARQWMPELLNAFLGIIIRQP